MIKKLISLFIAITMISCANLSASAETYPSSIDISLWETGDVEIQNGVLILSKTSMLKSEQNVTRTYSSNDENSEVTDFYVNQTAIIVPKEGFSTDDVYNELQNRYSSSSSRALGSKTESDRDSSISVEATLTIYYTRTTINDLSYVKLTKVDGSYRLLDRQVAIVSQVVTMGCTGWTTGGIAEQTIDLLDYGSTTSWSANMPSDWVYVADNGYSVFSVGANVIFTLRRKSTSDYTWKLYLNNQL